MIKVSVCVGSSCHVKGSKQVVESLQKLIAENKGEDQISLVGSFCMGHCLQDVTVTVDGDLFSVNPENVNEFFDKEIKTRMK